MMMRNGRKQQRTIPSRSNQSDGVSAAPNPAPAKNSDNSARKSNTPVDPKGDNDHMNLAVEQGEPADGEHSMEPLSGHDDPEGKTHQPVFGDMNSPDDEAHIIPKRHSWNKRTFIKGSLKLRGA